MLTGESDDTAPSEIGGHEEDAVGVELDPGTLELPDQADPAGAEAQPVEDKDQNDQGNESDPKDILD